MKLAEIKNRRKRFSQTIPDEVLNIMDIQLCFGILDRTETKLFFIFRFAGNSEGVVNHTISTFKETQL